MSLLIKALKPRQILEGLKVVSAIQARQGHFFPNFKPGPLPKTEEERIRAARKYNLHPDEYETYEEGSGFGDYPKLPFESVDSKDPWYLWDIDEFRRNYNEPVHANCVILIPEMISTDETRPTQFVRALIFLGVTSSLCGLLVFSKKYFNLVHPISEKQFVTPGVTHYTFEPDYEEALRRKKKKKKCADEEEGE